MNRKNTFVVFRLFADQRTQCLCPCRARPRRWAAARRVRVEAAPPRRFGGITSRQQTRRGWTSEAARPSPQTGRRRGQEPPSIWPTFSRARADTSAAPPPPLLVLRARRPPVCSSELSASLSLTDCSWTDCVWLSLPATLPSLAHALISAAMAHRPSIRRLSCCHRSIRRCKF
jgi:hypothetical protein